MFEYVTSVNTSYICIIIYIKAWNKVYTQILVGG